jgi:hypothetical protein
VSAEKHVKVPMKIKYTDNTSTYVAEEIDGGDGYFITADDGSILYKHESDSIKWYVNSNTENFRLSVEAFNRYSDMVVKFESEEKQLEIVAKLRKQLIDIENWEKESNSYWKVIVEQAEYGHI